LAGGGQKHGMSEKIQALNNANNFSYPFVTLFQI